MSCVTIIEFYWQTEWPSESNAQTSASLNTHTRKLRTTVHIKGMCKTKICEKVLWASSWHFPQISTASRTTHLLNAPDMLDIIDYSNTLHLTRRIPDGCWSTWSHQISSYSSLLVFPVLFCPWTLLLWYWSCSFIYFDILML